MRRRTVWWALGLYCAPLAILVFWPQGPRFERVPLPGWLRPGELGAAANVAVFVPFGFLAAMLFRRGRRWLGFLVGCGLSVSVEIVQAAFVSERSGTVRDVITNSAGALIGTVLCIMWLQVLRPRRPARSTGASPRLPDSSTTF